MTLSPGTQLGSFEVAGLLGVGGMGEVYRARDTKLGREVAIKVLPEVFAADQERAKRFEREARMLAALDHPNIAGIYDFQEADGHKFLVMQLVEGETLAERIKRGVIPVEEALPIFAQIAEALEAAHEHGIVHRDLKPANIKVGEDGRVKVLDFGLAKALETDGSSGGSAGAPPQQSAESDISTKRAILGTPAYMSPEQARAQGVDKRSDIWAFGCCLYESLTGERPFRGETASDLLAEILKSEPDWNALPAATPSRVRVLLWRCLQKDPKRRLRDIGDARIELDESGSDQSGTNPALEPTVEHTTGYPRWVSAILIALVLGAGVLIGGVLTRGRNDPTLLYRPPPASAFRTSILLDPEAPFSELGYLIVSPDGKSIVYVADLSGGTQLYLYSMSEGRAEPILGTELAADPFFSPDGKWIGFDDGISIKKVSIHGGPVETIYTGRVGKGAWLADDTIVFNAVRSFGPGLFRISAQGGEAQEITDPESEYLYGRPNAVAGANAVALSIIRIGADPSEPELAVFSLETKETHLLSIGGFFPRYAETGHLVYSRGSSLWAVPFDLERLDATGPPQPVLEEVEASLAGGRAAFGVSRDGTLVFAPRAGTGVQDLLVWVDRDGEEEELPFAAGRLAAGQVIVSPRVSPAGDRIAFCIGSATGGEIYIYDLNSSRPPTLLAPGFSSLQVIWDPHHGERLVINMSMVTRDAVWALASLPVDFSVTEPEAIYLSEDPTIPWDWGPEGKELIFTEQSPETENDIFALALGEGDEPRVLLQTAFRETHPNISPDGRWMAYSSDRLGRMDIWVLPFPDPDAGQPELISTEGGANPIFSKDGRELFYLEGRNLMVVRVPDENEDQWGGDPQRLIELSFSPKQVTRFRSRYDVSPNGQRFIMVKPGVGAARAKTQFSVIQNWFEELKRLAPTGEDSRN